MLTEAGLPWLIPLLSYFEVPLLTPSVLCATDPPALPSFTADDATALLNPWTVSPSDIATLGQKINDLITHLGWYVLCKCDVGSPTALPNPAVPAPTGMPTFVGATQSVVAAMRAADVRIFDMDNGSGGVLAAPTGWESLTFNDSAWPLAHVANTPVPFQNPNGLGTFGINPRPVPESQTGRQACAPWFAPPTPTQAPFLVRWRFTLPAFDPTQLAVELEDWAGAGSGGDWATGTAAINGLTDFPVFNNNNWIGHMTDFKVGANLIAFSVNGVSRFNAWGTVGGITAIVSQQGSQGSAVNTGCCPPDPAVMQLLRAILESSQLIQRQAVPFGYVASTVHTLLTGTGSIAVTGLIGALVTVTARNSAVGSEAGTPPTLFEAGWIRWGNADGFSQREWIEADTQVSLPAAAGQYTRITYTLTPGTAVTITELVREP